MVRAVILKGRQQGVSTYVTGRYFWKTVTNHGKQTYILTHEQSATDNLFGMTNRYLEHYPQSLRPKLGAANAKELVFSGLDSGYKIATAGNRGAGRSATAQYLLGCLAEGTQIIDGLTMSLKDVSKVHTNDLVITHCGNVAKISAEQSQLKECFDVAVNGVNGYPLIASGEHRFWTRTGWKELSEMKVGDEIGYPIRPIIHEIKLLPYAAEVMPRAHGGGCVEKVSKDINIDFNLGRVVGLYLAEGSIKWQAKYPEHPSSAIFTVHEKEVERTIEWLSSIPNLCKSITVNRRKTSKACNVIANGKSIGLFLNGLVGCKDKKHIPELWWKMGVDFVSGMIHGYMSGDGGHDGEYGRRISAVSIRPAISIGMREALASLGYGWATLNKKVAAVRNNRNEKEAMILRLTGSGAAKLLNELGKPCKNAYRVYKQKFVDISNGYAWVKVKHIIPVGVKKVYDFEVDHVDHSYCLLHGATHNSEVAYWSSAEEHLAGIMQTVPRMDDTEIIFESTANGIGNVFHSVWQQGEVGAGGWQSIFVPWFWQPEYVADNIPISAEDYEYGELYGLTTRQLQWRRLKISEMADEKLFCKEYPSTPSEAFSVSDDSVLINNDLVAKARKATATADGAKIIGVDPARFGDDRTVISIRQGRSAEILHTVQGKDTMQVVGLVVTFIKKYSPQAVFIDVGGLGAGVVDRLREMGYTMCKGVNFGEKSLWQDKYVNKRAEMWGQMNEWLKEPPVQLPDDDALQADLCSLRYDYDSHGRLKLETKDDAKKRGVRSPDLADSIALTFAFPVRLHEDRAFTLPAYKPRVKSMGI